MVVVARPDSAAAALLAAEVWLGAAGVRAWLPFVVLLPLAAVGLWWLGRIRVAVADDELRVDDARLPVRYVADAIPLDAAGRRELLGVGADPLRVRGPAAVGAAAPCRWCSTTRPTRRRTGWSARATPTGSRRRS